MPDQAPLPVGTTHKLVHMPDLQELVDFGQHGMKVRFRYQAPDGVAVPPSGIEYAADVEVPLALQYSSIRHLSIDAGKPSVTQDFLQHGFWREKSFDLF